jgi:hypothetical protein
MVPLLLLLATSLYAADTASLQLFSRGEGLHLELRHDPQKKKDHFDMKVIIEGTGKKAIYRADPDAERQARHDARILAHASYGG